MTDKEYQAFKTSERGRLMAAGTQRGLTLLCPRATKNMKQIIKDIYLSIAVLIPYTNAWKARKRMKACEESQGSITFTRKFFIDDDLPLPPEFAGA